MVVVAAEEILVLTMAVLFSQNHVPYVMSVDTQHLYTHSWTNPEIGQGKVGNETYVMIRVGIKVTIRFQDLQCKNRHRLKSSSSLCIQTSIIPTS